MCILKKIIFIICLFCTAHLTVFAQSITVTGKITDEANEPLPGVSVSVKGTTIGTTSIVDGTFQLTVPSASAVLLFSYMGFTSMEMTVGSQRVFNVTLREDVSTLEEVVVIGYGTQKKVSVTSAISSVDAAELVKSPTASLGNALAGRLPGLAAIQYSGLPGFDDPTIYIRGVGTLNESNSRPLILVDGVERQFTQLNANEVADISILKDAGATAVFGVRGANGVILVTTKRGEAGKARVSASASYGIQQPIKIVEFANSYLYATTYNEAQRTDGLDPKNFTFSPEAIEHYKLGDQPVLYPSVDWMSYIMRKSAPQNDFNISVSGGNDRARYFVLVSKTFVDGLFNTFVSDKRENFKFNRYNYRANMDINLTNTTIMGITLGGRIEERNSTNDPNSSADGPNREGTIFRYLVEAAPMSGAGIIDGKHVTYNRELTPLMFPRDGLNQHYARGFRNEVVNVLNFDLMLTQKLDMVTKGLSLLVKGSYNNRFGLEKRRPTDNNGMMGVSTYYPHPVRDPATGKLTGYVLEKQTDSQVLAYEESLSFTRDWRFDVTLNYSRQFNRVHNVSALWNYNQSKNYYPSNYTDIPRGYIGTVGRIQYDYQMKYMADVNFGYNGSENFIEGRRYGFFPSASVGWTLTEEEFMKDIVFLDYLKIRYSNGMGGNDGNIGRFLYLPASYANGMPSRGSTTAMGTGTAFGYRGEAQAKPNVRESTLGNPNISWEKSRKQNLGIDMRLFRNRLNVGIDIFKEHSWDCIITPSASIPNHFALPNVPAINYAIVDNKGYEVSFKWTDRVGKDFSYTIAPHVSFSRNKRVKIMEVPPAEPYLINQGTRVGQPFGYAFFGYYYKGIEADYEKYMKSRPDYAAYMAKERPTDENGKEIPWKFPDHQVALKPGDCVYLDLNYDGKIDANDQHAIGHPNWPEYEFGLTMSFKYKRFDFSMLWKGSTNTNRDLGGAYRPAFGTQNTGALIRWVAENSWTEQNPNAPFPRITFANRTNNTLFSEVYLVDASYARLKNVEVSYRVDMSKVPYISDLSLYANASNLLTFTNYHANDPETSGAGFGEFFRYPPLRVYNFGFRLTY